MIITPTEAFQADGGICGSMAARIGPASPLQHEPTADPSLLSDDSQKSQCGPAAAAVRDNGLRSASTAGSSRAALTHLRRPNVATLRHVSLEMPESPGRLHRT